MTKVNLANARLEESTKIQVISSTTFVTPQLSGAIFSPPSSTVVFIEDGVNKDEKRSGLLFMVQIS